VSAAAHRSILVGGGGAAAQLAAAAGRRGSGGGRRGGPKKIPKNFVLSSKFSEDLFTHRKLQQNKYIATIASAVRPQIIGGGQQISSKIPEKISFYRNNFLMTFS